MPQNNRNVTLGALLLPTALGLITGLVPSSSRAGEKRDEATRARPAAGLGLAEFNELKPLLDLKNQPWTTIPWKYSITEARTAAAAAKKPIFMVVNTGNALGCT